MLDTSQPQNVDAKNKVVPHSGGKLRKAMEQWWSIWAKEIVSRTLRLRVGPPITT
jgi:hypothetical protein